MTMMKLLILTLFFVSSFCFADDPNMLIKNGVNEGGTTFTGSYSVDEQASFCPTCQSRNKLKLSDQKDHAKPGDDPTSKTPTTGSGKGTR
jgi:hypothetical protein